VNLGDFLAFFIGLICWAKFGVFLKPIGDILRVESGEFLKPVGDVF
jgi:hypothetical protein